MIPALPAAPPVLPRAGRLLGPADFGNVIVLGECIQVSVEVLQKPRGSPHQHRHEQGTRDTWHCHPVSTPCPLSEPLLPKPPCQDLHTPELSSPLSDPREVLLLLGELPSPRTPRWLPAGLLTSGPSFTAQSPPPSVTYLHSLLVGFGCFLQDPFHLLERGEKSR